MVSPSEVFIRAEAHRLSAAGAEWLSGEEDGAGREKWGGGECSGGAHGVSH